MDLRHLLEMWHQCVAASLGGNTVQDYSVAMAVFLWIWLMMRLVMRIAVARLEKFASRTATAYDDIIVAVLKRHLTPSFYLVVALYFAGRCLVIPVVLQQLLRGGLVLVLTTKAVWTVQDLLLQFLEIWIKRSQQNKPTILIMLRNLTLLVQMLLWGAGLLFALDNIGINVTAFLAGLGIGGVAVALAVQHTLGDAISSFAIFLDKPFEVGDFIIVGDLMGTVEYVGFKTTRLRSLSGEQLIFGNSDLTSSRIRNFKRMAERRIVFKIGLVYETPIDKLRGIPSQIEAIIREQPQTRFDRAHFMSFGDFALEYEIVYFVLSADYNRYMDIQQSINLKVMDLFQKQGIEFAYPTQVTINRVDRGPDA